MNKYENKVITNLTNTNLAYCNNPNTVTSAAFNKALAKYCNFKNFKTNLLLLSAITIILIINMIYICTNLNTLSSNVSNNKGTSTFDIVSNNKVECGLILINLIIFIGTGITFVRLLRKK